MYILEETDSPNGYTKVQSEFVFVVENGKVSLHEAYTTGASVKNGNEIIVMDEISEIDFYKFYDIEENTDPDGTYQGSEVKLTFKKASDKAATVIEGADTLEVGESITWNTTDANPKTLRGLMDGEYILEELKAPAIYEKAEPRTVIIKDGAVALMNNGRIIGSRPYTHLLNVKKGSIVIDKKALGAKEIPEEAGKAKFTLIANDEGADLKGIVVNSSEITESTDRITFDGNTVTLIGLADGEYTLIEDTAPIGYDVVSEFKFTVQNYTVTRIDPVTNGRAYTENNGKNIVVEDDHLKYINNISLTLSDTLGLNFYLNELIPAYEAADYKVLLTGNCLENGQMVEFTEKNGKYCVTAHVYAKDLNEKIVAEVVKKDKVIYTSEPYSVSDYLESALENVTEPEALALIKATKVFGSASADYFYEGDHGFAESLEAYLKQTDISEDDLIRLGMLDQYAPNFDSNEAKISLVLNSRTAIRLYIKGVAAKTKSGSLISEASTKVNKTTYPSYFEITEITPDQLAKNYTITLKDKNYSLSALSWVYRVMNNYISDEDSVSDKNLKMAKAITAYYIAANEYVNADHATTS